MLRPYTRRQCWQQSLNRKFSARPTEAHDLHLSVMSCSCPNGQGLMTAVLKEPCLFSYSKLNKRLIAAVLINPENQLYRVNIEVSKTGQCHIVSTTTKKSKHKDEITRYIGLYKSGVCVSSTMITNSLNKWNRKVNTGPSHDRLTEARCMIYIKVKQTKRTSAGRVARRAKTWP